ncbi:Alpha/Beta hydrolase protein [Hygrophoropsis aurantiaca]|uniref:Alpha/Beta hydrolase protein n=1 Tax=Hygrophoropsis aurantiaca TaxID=72124 RepID=A0ACB8AB03_9AGAM|nr:Alpha/Beta hydrolase protein [Hygrophoropsis aurantiaca]
MPTNKELTIWDKLYIGSALIYTFFSTLFHGRLKTLDRELSNARTRAITRRLNDYQLQTRWGSSEAAWNMWCALQSDTEYHTEDLYGDAKLYWIGNDVEATKIMLYVHGGGYVLPLTIEHLKLLTYFRDCIQRDTGVDMAIAVLEYTLAPQASYPTQFHQIDTALHHLLNDGVMPSNLIIAGDSEGAHIALCAISHILHQHPTLDEPPSMVDAFGGLLFISPRTTNSIAARSFKTNSNRDIFCKETLSRWISAFRAHSNITSQQGLEDDGYYTEPLLAPNQWWDGLANEVVKKVFISAGENECYRDDIEAFAEHWKKSGVDCTRMTEEEGVQVSPISDFGAGRPPSDLTLAIVKWLVEVVQG